MRKREQIETDGSRVDKLILETLLDIREFLNKKPTIKKSKPKK